MEPSAHSLLSSWEAFYVIVGSSAAALTGLQFVVIALIADTPDLGNADSVAAFGTPTVVHFCLCLYIAALLSAPWPSLTPVMWLLLLAAVAGVVYALIVLRRAHRQTSYDPVAEDWLWHTILPLVAYGLLIVAALGLLRFPVASLFVVGAVALLLIYIGIHNAWDTVAYVAIKHAPKKKS